MAVVLHRPARGPISQHAAVLQVLPRTGHAASEPVPAPPVRRGGSPWLLSSPMSPCTRSRPATKPQDRPSRRTKQGADQRQGPGDSVAPVLQLQAAGGRRATTMPWPAAGEGEGGAVVMRRTFCAHLSPLAGTLRPGLPPPTTLHCNPEASLDRRVKYEACGSAKEGWRRGAAALQVAARRQLSQDAASTGQRLINHILPLHCMMLAEQKLLKEGKGTLEHRCHVGVRQRGNSAKTPTRLLTSSNCSIVVLELPWSLEN